MSTSRGPSRVLDEVARLFTDTAGAAQGVRREVETLVRGQTERLIGQLDLVQREEFEVVREMAVRARTENEELKRRIAALEGAAGTSDETQAKPFDGPTPPTL